MLGKLSTGRKIRRSIFGILVVIWSLGPIYWALNVSFTTQVGLENSTANLVPSPFTLSQYGDLLRPGQPLAGGFYLALRNSVIQAGAATVLAAVVALFSGYAFGRWTFFGSKSLFLLVVATLSLPLLAVLLPLFKWTSELHLINTFPPLILLALSASLPLAVWIMRSFVTSLPPDLEGAARIDGASEFRLLRSIVLPLLGPAVAAVAIIVFLTTWSAFLVPVFFTQTSATQPLTIFVPNLAAKNAENIGVQAAAACLALLVPVTVVVLLHRYIVGGLLRGAYR
jgi:multiple sugar transport system permease protein